MQRFHTEHRNKVVLFGLFALHCTFLITKNLITISYHSILSPNCLIIRISLLNPISSTDYSIKQR